MTEEEKQALRNSFAGKAVSDMTAEERKVFDQDFQYRFGSFDQSWRQPYHQDQKNIGH